MRKVGYFFVGWILFGFAFNGLIVLASGEVSGLVVSAAAVAGFVWLLRSYRRGSGQPSGWAPVAAYVFDELRRLEERLPADPLESGTVVGAWSIHLHDPEATERLRSTYAAMRGAVAEARADLEAAEPAGAEERARRLEARLAEVQDYVHALDLLAQHEPELVQTAITEHAQAQTAVERARQLDVPVDELLAADARLQGARTALRRAEERPLDALRLAEEAEQLADHAATAAVRRAELPSTVASARQELEAARASLSAAAERHPSAALAEVRGLPALAAEHLDRGAVEPALAMIRRVEAHLIALERAAATARPLLEAAEEAVDEALTRSVAGAERAAELTAAGRAELDREKPDWLEIVGLVDRARRLLDGARASVQSPPQDVLPARDRARTARDEVWAWALTVGPKAELARAVAEEIDGMLESADRAESEGDAAQARALYVRAAATAEAAVEDAARAPVRRRAG
jgi:hypothetical protein